jgi:hypothetical protein
VSKARRTAGVSLTIQFPFSVGRVRLVQCTELVAKICERDQQLYEIPRIRRYTWIRSRSRSVCHRTRSYAGSVVRLHLASPGISVSVERMQSSCRRTWSKSHLFKNNTMLTLARSLFATTDFHSRSESSSRFTRGSSSRFWSKVEIGARKMIALTGMLSETP